MKLGHYRLLYVDSELQAGIIAGMLAFNFDNAAGRDAKLRRKITTWASRHPLTEEAERTAAEIIASALMPAAIEYGDYGEGHTPAIRATPRQRVP